MNPPPAWEVNFDGLVGPTHNYAGLAHDNLASQRHARRASSPRAAALEGLRKMKFVADLGVRQAVLPPQVRPDLSALRRLGFDGSDAAAIGRAGREDLLLLAACCSASSMWAANAATISPGADAADHRLHITPANLVSQFHRSLEAGQTGAVLRRIFPPGPSFVHHDPLPATLCYCDEGAANHVRLAATPGGPGLEIFVYGRRAASGGTGSVAAHFAGRQTLEASTAVARLHQLAPETTLFVQQNTAAIDAGVFHNDVIAVGHLDVLLYHEMAFAGGPAIIGEIAERFAMVTAQPLHLICAREEDLALADAVASYLFNSQIVTLPDGSMALIAPSECQDMPRVRRFIDRMIAADDNPISVVHFVEVRQSMQNGGGPACLRLRIVLTETELAAMNPGVLLTESLYDELTAWVHRHYRSQLVPEDLRDPTLYDEGRRALIELDQLMGGVVFGER